MQLFNTNPLTKVSLLISLAFSPLPSIAQEQITASQITNSTSLRSWKNWYPFDRGQQFGERLTSGWITAPLAVPRGAGQNTSIGGQSTWRFPLFNTIAKDQPFAGMPSNRPNIHMPEVYGEPGRVKPHVINYMMNWWCPVDTVFDINDPANNCPMTNYNEIQSEAPDAAGNPSMYLATWGWGKTENFTSLHTDIDCPKNTDVSVLLNKPSYRAPLLWGLPQTPVGIARFKGPSVCAVNISDYKKEIGRARTFVVILAKQPILDNYGNRVIEAINGYYGEQDPNNPAKTTSGSACMTSVPHYAQGLALTEEYQYQDSDNNIRKDYTACLTMTEQYYMREIKPQQRLRNGFGSWTLNTAGQMLGPDWNHQWSNTTDQFARDTCQKSEHGNPINCSVNNF